MKGQPSTAERRKVEEVESLPRCRPGLEEKHQQKMISCRLVKIFMRRAASI